VVVAGEPLLREEQAVVVVAVLVALALVLVVQQERLIEAVAEAEAGRKQ
jgi:hypothetical protein